ncbi:MAG: glycosyltransferase family 2 protein [Chloroflexi bacterium]|nr:glycosyltransferase family 2 protein [Ardenticatenaceae bacterium]NOG34404.1 glycosyltransferase family 2 protein [Chloroflexota bacterium]GIK55967.1 MAG: glycosyl transferase [Chloroflexota bacterium]
MLPVDRQLSIVIVSWNVRELLRECLRSIVQTQGDLTVEVIVVDSASTDGSAAMVVAEFPQVTLIASDENVGFPRGNNMGIAKAHGRYILLLNPDTVLHENALVHMVDYLENHLDVGVVGAQLLNEDGSVQSSRRRFPTLTTAFFESTWLQSKAPQRILDRYYALDMADDQTADVDWVMGACLMTRQEIAHTVGGLDEGYFMYSEELDWCRRIKMAGWRVVYLPTAQITHYQGKSSEQVVAQRHIYFNRAKLRYFRKYHGRAPALILRLFLLLNYLAQMVLEAGKGVVGHKRPLRWQRVHAYWLVIRSGLRPAGY